jgi:hypothetical protein
MDAVATAADLLAVTADSLTVFVDSLPSAIDGISPMLVNGLGSEMRLDRAEDCPIHVVLFFGTRFFFLPVFDSIRR